MPETDSAPEAQRPSAERATLPLLPLSTGVVLPQMVVTLALETDEARAAADAADRGRRRAPARAAPRRALRAGRHRGTRRELRRPPQRRSCGRPARPAPGRRRRRCRGEHRRPVGRGRRGRATPSRPSDRSSWLASTAAAVGAIGERMRGARDSRTRSPASLIPARSPTPRGGGPTCPLERRSSCSRRSMSRSASSSRSRGRATRSPSSRSPRRSAPRSSDGMDKQQREFLLRRQLDAIRKELGEADDDDRRRVPRAVSRSRDVPEAVREADRARARPARADRRAEPRAGLDPDVARHDPRPAVGRRAPRTTLDVVAARVPCSTPTTPASTT